jgi:hypothetical protein
MKMVKPESEQLNAAAIQRLEDELARVGRHGETLTEARSLVRTLMGKISSMSGPPGDNLDDVLRERCLQFLGPCMDTDGSDA